MPRWRTASRSVPVARRILDALIRRSRNRAGRADRSRSADLDILRPPPWRTTLTPVTLPSARYGEVDVDQNVARPAERTPGAGSRPRPCCCGHMPGSTWPMAHLTERDGADAEQGSFHGRRHGAGIGDVLAQIAAAIDARQHQVRPLGLRASDGPPAARSRSACRRHGKAPRCDPANLQRPAHGERVAGPLCSISGATTQTSSDKERAIFSSTLRPGASMPSSLLTRIRACGRSAMGSAIGADRREPTHIGLQHLGQRDRAVRRCW